ncbi:MAG: site-2 protease family protein [Chloroflexi bacterium]|nr:site-2 protease family protein [Chloroflexota bacterium]
MFILSLLNQPLHILVFYVIAMIIAITLHELAHAVWSDRLGDPTPRNFGRISLNPLRHLDPVGTLMFFLAGIIWASTPTNPSYYRIGARKGSAQVALAGPLTNFALALVAALPFRVGILTMPISGSAPVQFLSEFLLVFVGFNLLLTVFNLIPIPPLDGFTVLLGLLPEQQARSLTPLYQYGPMLLLFLFMADSFTPINIFGAIIGPPRDFLSDVLLGG